MKLTLPLLLCLTALAPSLPEHGGQTLLRLSRTPRTNAPPATVVSSPIQPLPSIMPPALSTNLLRAVPRTNGPVIYRPTPFAPTQAGKLYHLLHSTDFTNWTVVKSDLVGPNNTNGDVFATNRLPKEFWKVLPQDGWSTNVGKARQQPRIGGLRWDLDPSVITK